MTHLHHSQTVFQRTFSFCLQSLEGEIIASILQMRQGSHQTAVCCSVSLSHVQLFKTPWTAAHQASLSFTVSWSLLRLMSLKLAMPSNHLILCHLLLFLPSVFPSIRIFSSKSALHLRWLKD